MHPIVIDLETVAIEDAETYIEAVSAPDNYKKPEAIAKYQAEARANAIDKAAVDIDLARIIALGLKVADQPTEVWLQRDMSETEMLTKLWAIWHTVTWESRQFITYNGLGFDVVLLLRRSLYLGVKAPIIQCDRFKHPQVVDLMAVLNMDGKFRSRGLQFYLNRLGYPKGGPDITGADVGAAYAAGDWAAIEAHCRADVEATAWLAQRLTETARRSFVPIFTEAEVF